MAVTTDAPVPADVVEEIAGSDGFLAGRAVSLTASPRRAAAPRPAPSWHSGWTLRPADPS